MRDVMNRIEEVWCAAMHERTMWPIHGKYRCGTCLREYPVQFGVTGDGDAIAHPSLTADRL